MSKCTIFLAPPTDRMGQGPLCFGYWSNTPRLDEVAERITRDYAQGARVLQVEVEFDEDLLDPLPAVHLPAAEATTWQAVRDERQAGDLRHIAEQVAEDSCPVVEATMTPEGKAVALKLSGVWATEDSLLDPVPPMTKEESPEGLLRITDEGSHWAAIYAELEALDAPTWVLVRPTGETGWVVVGRASPATWQSLADELANPDDVIEVRLARLSEVTVEGLPEFEGW